MPSHTEQQRFFLLETVAAVPEAVDDGLAFSGVHKNDGLT